MNEFLDLGVCVAAFKELLSPGWRGRARKGDTPELTHRCAGIHRFLIFHPPKTLSLNAVLHAQEYYVRAVAAVPEEEFEAQIAEAKRRHLTPSQAPAAVEALPFFEAEARKRQGKRNDLKPFTCSCGEAFSEPVWHCPQCAHHWPMGRGECWNCHNVKRPKNITEILPESFRGESRHRAGEVFNVSGRYVSEAKVLKEINPMIFEQVREFSLRIPSAFPFARV
jgi:hypothetical protein